MEPLLTLALHLVSIGAILALMRWLLVRPIVKMKRESDEMLNEMRELTARIRASDAGRERQVREGVETLERLRGAAADMIRQESRIIVDMTLRDAKKRAEEMDKELAAL